MTPPVLVVVHDRHDTLHKQAKDKRAKPSHTLHCPSRSRRATRSQMLLHRPEA
jgi:hypothetical protein